MAAALRIEHAVQRVENRQLSHFQQATYENGDGNQFKQAADDNRGPYNGSFHNRRYDHDHTEKYDKKQNGQIKLPRIAHGDVVGAEYELFGLAVGMIACERAVSCGY